MRDSSLRSSPSLRCCFSAPRNATEIAAGLLAHHDDRRRRSPRRGRAPRGGACRASTAVRGLAESGRMHDGRDHRVLAQDHGAVVERRAGAEQRDQQLGRDLGVDARAGLDEVAQPDVALDHDQRAVAALRPASRRRARPRPARRSCRRAGTSGSSGCGRTGRARGAARAGTGSRTRSARRSSGCRRSTGPRSGRTRGRRAPTSTMTSSPTYICAERVPLTRIRSR